MNIIIEKDHSLCVAKILCLYYKNAHIMNIIHVHETFQDIFKTKFFKLFFHWSWQVRNIFYYLLIFIVNHRIKNKTFTSERNKLSKERLEKLNQKDENGFYQAFTNDYPEQVRDYFVIYF